MSLQHIGQKGVDQELELELEEMKRNAQRNSVSGPPEGS